jgi:hypothetical protein
MNFAIELVIAVICGGTAGVLYDRRIRRFQPPRPPARDINHLHVIEDEWHTPDVHVHGRSHR